MSGVRQSDLGQALGWSRSWVGTVERHEASDLGVVDLARLCAAVGLDLSVRAFTGPTVLRDAGQVALVNRFVTRIGPALSWRLEAPVAPDDQRAFDVLLGRHPCSVAVEAITRLRDVQAQVRVLESKVSACPGVVAHLLLVAATRSNRQALLEAGPQLRRAYPLGTRLVMAMLGRGQLPERDGIVVL